MRYVGVGRRFLALLVDLAISVAWLLLFLDVERSSGYIHVELLGGDAVAYWAVSLAYVTIMEGLWGATVGKFATGLRVVGADGRKLGFGAAVARNLARVVDALPFYVPFLVGALSVWTSPARQRLGDRWARSVVVEASSLGAPAAQALGFLPPPPPTPGDEGPPAPPPPALPEFPEPAPGTGSPPVPPQSRDD